MNIVAFCKRVQYWKQDYNTAKIVSFLTNQIAVFCTLGRDRRTRWILKRWRFVWYNMSPSKSRWFFIVYNIRKILLMNFATIVIGIQSWFSENVFGLWKLILFKLFSKSFSSRMVSNVLVFWSGEFRTIIFIINFITWIPIGRRLNQTTRISHISRPFWNILLLNIFTGHH